MIEMEEVKFEGLSKKVKEIEIDGKKLKIKPKRKHAEIFATLTREKFTKEDSAKITDLLIDMIKLANPAADKEDIEAYVVANYGALILELAPIFRFATRKETKQMMEKLKKEGEKKIAKSTT